MADVEFSTLVSRVNTSTPGCDFATITNHIRDAAISTCERTLAYRYAVPLFTLNPGVHEYAFEVPTNTTVQAILGAIVNDRPLDVLTLEQALKQHPEWADLYSGQDASVVWSETESGSFNTGELGSQEFNDSNTYSVPASIVADGSQPRVLTQITPDKFVVLPLPDATVYTVRMFVALKPKRTATGMNSVMLDKLEDTIVHRALQNLLIMPNVPWKDRELATYHARQYNYHANIHYAQANIGNQRASMRVENVRFA